MENLESMAGDFLNLLADMREKFLRPVEQITRSRLSPIQFHILFMLYHKGSLPMTELARKMKISKQQLTPLIAKLIDSNLVIRKTDENDRRIIRIEITEPGSNMVEELVTETRHVLAEKFKTLPEQELRELKQLLQKIHDILQRVR